MPKYTLSIFRIIGAFFLLGGLACAQKPFGSSKVVSYTVRLKPHQDLKQELLRITHELNLQAASIVSAVGSLEKVSLRLANQETPSNFSGFHEIVALSGTLGSEGIHVHLAVADKTGKTIGGHLVDGNPIYTTCELVLLEQIDLHFGREKDPTSGYSELLVQPRQKK